MSHKFGPGEYRTRDGRKAIVEFVLNEPCEKRKVVGQVLGLSGRWALADWTESGSYLTSESEQTCWDLMPPAREVLGVFFSNGDWHSGSSDVTEAEQRADSIRGSCCLMREVCATVSDKE